MQVYVEQAMAAEPIKVSMTYAEAKSLIDVLLESDTGSEHSQKLYELLMIVTNDPISIERNIMNSYKQEIKAVASTCLVVLFCVFSATMIVDMAVKLTKMPC